MFQNECFEELLVQYYEDLLAKNPLEQHRNESGEIQFENTGDSLIDHWEAKIASGEEVDLWDSFSPQARASLEEKLARARNKKKHRIGG